MLNVHDGGNNDVHSHWRLLGRSLDAWNNAWTEFVSRACMHTD